MTKTKLQKKIKKFFSLEQKIWKHVGCPEDYYSGLRDCTETSFAISSDNVLYGTPGTDDVYGGEVYGKAVFRGKHYTIAVVDDGQGNRQKPLLFDNTQEVDYEEFEGDE